jgi:maltose alpha-D-glucosyltransferase/alpha-amylase
MQWDDSVNAGFTTGKPFTEFVKGEFGCHNVNVSNQLADENSLWHSINHMVIIRKKHHAFGRGSMQWVETHNSAAAVYLREHQGESLLILNNLSDSIQVVSFPLEYYGGHLDLLSNANYKIGSTFTLQPYSYLWLKVLGG